MTFPDILCVKNYKRLKNHFTSMSLFLTQIDISLIVLMASTERTPEEEVHITRPSWSKPEVKRLGKDDFFKEVHDIDELIDVFLNLFKLLADLDIVFQILRILNFDGWEENVFLGLIIKVIVVRIFQFFFFYSITSFKYELIITNSSSSCEGCCWAFTSTEAITAAYALKNKREIVSLSKQQLIDCMYTKYKKPSYFADLGEKECFPCSYNKAYKFAMDYGITLETKYPFMEERGKCECQTEIVGISSFNLPVVIRTYS